VSTSLGPTPRRRVIKRYRMLRGYLKQRAFAGVWLSRREVAEVIEMLKPFYEARGAE
jgi:hypothetical protein